MGGAQQLVARDHRNKEVAGMYNDSQNLLKGDIGHLVSRNQSAQLLGSKVGKAKIVAEDQLKRVTLALAKDRE